MEAALAAALAALPHGLQTRLQPHVGAWALQDEPAPALAAALSFLAANSPAQPSLQHVPLAQLLRSRVEGALSRLAAAAAHPPAFIDAWNACVSQLAAQLADSVCSSSAGGLAARWRFPPPHLSSASLTYAPGVADAQLAALHSLLLPAWRPDARLGSLEQVASYCRACLPASMAAEGATLLSALPAIAASSAGKPVAVPLATAFALLFQQLWEQLASCGGVAVAAEAAAARAAAQPRPPAVQLFWTQLAEGEATSAPTAASGQQASLPPVGQATMQARAEAATSSAVKAAAAAALNEALAAAAQLGLQLPAM